MGNTAQKVAYNVWSDLGKIDAFDEFIATGGSTSTVINGKIADRLDRPEDNYSIDYTAIVIRDAAGAAPEGEMQRISSFNSSTYAHTVDTNFTVAVASGDAIAIANADIPLREMYRAINNALVKMGEIPLVDTSLTTAANQTEYTLPVAMKREDLLRVEYQGFTGDTNDNRWEHIQNFDVIPSAPGVAGTLIIPQMVEGRTLKLTYMGTHPVITTFSSEISEYLHPSVVIAAVKKSVLGWYNASIGGGDSYWLQKENEAAQDFEQELRRHPLWMPKKTPKYYEVTSSSGKYKDPLVGTHG